MGGASFSGIALIVSLRVHRRQSVLIEKQIAQHDRDARSRVQAEVHVSLEGPSSHRRIAIRNDGPSEAREVDLRVLGNNSPLIENDVAEKLPIPVLAATGAVTLAAAISNDCRPPFHVVLTWRDGSGSRSREATLA
jgi:hypothetical protein